ncbi:MAG: 2-dehydropantoate 2-reductase, partial [Rhodospirillaceae bacterium]|nr:2-dehydropantoate 2-reductase [Rhodospirillaceae bacterium]
AGPDESGQDAVTAIRSICIVGPGALGGMMAVKFTRAGFAVSALARPDSAARIAARGITLHEDGQSYHERIKVAADPAALGPHDLVVVTVKTGGLAAVASHLPAVSRSDTPWVIVANGVPWWFFDDFGGAHAGMRLTSVDPAERLRTAIPTPRAIWGVINCRVSFRPDGSLSHEHSNHLQLGRPDRTTAGLDIVADTFRTGGYVTEPVAAIHEAIWGKLLANMTFNPISALTMATTDVMLSDPLVRELAVAVTDEGRAVGAALGLPPGPSGADRFPVGRKLARAATSMLSDVERGRPLELDALVAAVVEIADRVGVPVPFTRMLLGLARVRSHTLSGAA